jgi:cell division protein FtsB
MIVLREMRRRCRAVVGPVLGLAVTGYFLYNLIEGNRGLLAWLRATQEIAATKTAVQGAQKAEAQLRRKDYELSPDHLDLDLLDERVRIVLDRARPNEIVIREKPER